MKPMLGECVYFTFDRERADKISRGEAEARRAYGQGVTVPAIVLAAWSEDCVNLRVLVDGPGPDLWETSVMKKGETTGDGSYWEFPADVAAREAEAAAQGQ